MVRENQADFDFNCCSFRCLSCQRHFSSASHLLQHCQHASCHGNSWCERCRWLFVSPQALMDHKACSVNHWLCQFCTFDFASIDERHEHTADHHLFCTHCQDYFDDYQEHREDCHNRCSICANEFRTPNELRMVMSMPLSPRTVLLS